MKRLYNGFYFLSHFSCFKVLTDCKNCNVYFAKITLFGRKSILKRFPHVYLSDGTIANKFPQICLNPHQFFITSIIPFSLPIWTTFKQMWETIIFIFKKYKQLLEKSYPIMMNCILKSLWTL